MSSRLQLSCEVAVQVDRRSPKTTPVIAESWVKNCSQKFEDTASTMYLALDKQLIGQTQPSCLTLAPTYILYLIGKGRGRRTARDDQNVSLQFFRSVSLELTAALIS
jgi:hypothetical protein